MKDTWFASCSLAFLVLHGASAPLHLDIDNNLVPITLDGHTVKLFLDSATPHWLVVSGEAYEKAHGKGACRDLETGCYFCPPTQPCNDISEQPGKTITYLDGDTMEYVNRIGTLSIGEVSDIEVKFFLIISFRSPLRKMPPKGILGLALGGEQLSMLEQLKLHRVISENSVAIEARETGRGITGNLFLGNSPKSLTELTSVKCTSHPTYFHRCLASLRSEVKPVNHRNRRRRRGAFRDPSGVSRQLAHVIVDTGASLLALTNREYELILSEMRCRIKRYGPYLSEPLRVDELGMVWADSRALRHLPVLSFDLIDDSDARPVPVRISPRHYIRQHLWGESMLDLLVTSNTLLNLGHPFFRAYYTFLNLDSMMLYITPNDARRVTSPPRLSTQNGVELLHSSGPAPDDALPQSHGLRRTLLDEGSRPISKRRRLDP